MAKVIIHVWHTVTGEIVAVGRPMGGAKCIPLSGENQAVMETDVEEDQIQGLHQTHVVDAARKAVVPHSDHQ